MLDLSTLDAEIAQIGHMLRIARECDFTEITAVIERDIVEDVLPGVAVLMTVAGGDDHTALADRHRRLRLMLG